MLRQYLKRILKVARLGDAREESYYSALETLLNEFAVSEKKKGIHVTSQPKKQMQAIQTSEFGMKDGLLDT